MLLYKKVLIVGGLVGAASAAAWGVYRLTSGEPAPAFRFTTVSRGAIQALVSSTGTLQAVTTVSVGTQVSGQISALLVDFNDQVKKGQLLARIDPTIARQGVADAQANLERVQAQAGQARSDQNRNRALSTAGLIAGSALEQGGSTQKVADATVRSAAVALERAKQNLSFTSIYAPIDGVVVERNVNLGQTVAASLSAPQLFLIANDLSRMQILALVGESDIVRIRQEQAVTFTVQAMPGQKFSGSVQQVRLQSTTADNVVNYTVVVTLENPGGKLLPGMTARVDFLVKSAENVLRAPNAALRYKPSDDVLARFGTKEASPKEGPATGGTPAAGAGAGVGSARTRRAEGGASGSGRGTLYTLDPKEKLQAVRVKTGVTDGLFTEVEGKGVTEGMKVIDGLVAASSTPAAAAANPMGGQQQQGGRGRPSGGF
ncbi:MAG: efflux RND transporter periplasmic adaptor subunit [Holophagales bacterium]|nr:efflux RND transporter periplasmic adaptor subunit [Holophagales bacterium]